MLYQPDVTLLPDARHGEPEGWRASPWTAQVRLSHSTDKLLDLRTAVQFQRPISKVQLKRCPKPMVSPPREYHGLRITFNTYTYFRRRMSTGRVSQLEEYVQQMHVVADWNVLMAGADDWTQDVAPWMSMVGADGEYAVPTSALPETVNDSVQCT